LHLSSIRHNASFPEEREENEFEIMKIDALVGLKNRIDAVLASKCRAPRALEATCEADPFRVGGHAFEVRWTWNYGQSCAEISQPENPSETWAGRGLKPRWLAAAIKSERSSTTSAFPPRETTRRRRGRSASRRVIGIGGNGTCVAG
jgi:DNA-binding protein H-NS